MVQHNLDKLYVTWRHQHDLLRTLTKLFVVGCPKSGTTWLVNLLNGHPQVVVRGEGSFAYQLLPAMTKAFDYFNEHQQRFQKDEITQLRELDKLFLHRTAVDSILAHYVEASGRDILQLRVVGDKTPQHGHNVALLGNLYPDSRILHIVRDPRDAAVSSWFHFGKGSDRSFEEHIPYYIQNVWGVHVHLARSAGASLGERFLEIRYEDLHGREAACMEGVLRHIGVEATTERVQACIEAGSFEKASGGRKRGDEGQDSLARKGIIGDWANHLDPATAARWCEPVAPLMRAYGYDPAAGAAPLKRAG